MLLLLLGCGVDVPTPDPPARDPSRRWGEQLAAIVSPEGLVDYEALRADPAPLADFVGWVGSHGPETDGFKLMDDDRRLAWHLNAYNALVLWGVLQHWPLASVRDLPGPFGPGTGFFWKLRFRIDGERMHLHAHEQRVIFATYQEPLAHAALNCASRSCPPLRPTLFTARGIDEELEDQMRLWVAAGAVAVEPDGSFSFNAIFDWYAEDFRAWAGADTPCRAVRPYADAELAAALDARPDCPHRFAPYDWSLNQAPR